MDEKLRQELIRKKIRDMIAPTILLNEDDIKELEVLFNAETNLPLHKSIPVEVSSLIERGNMIIYDKEYNKLDYGKK